MFTQIFWYSLQFAVGAAGGFVIAQTIMFFGYEPNYMTAKGFYMMCFAAGFAIFPAIFTVFVVAVMELRKDRRLEPTISEAEGLEGFDDLLSRDAGRESLPRPRDLLGRRGL
jgi:hypothetical protein